MLRLLGVTVSDDDVRQLIATLLAEGSQDALSAAAMLEKGVDRGLYAVGLTRPERTAVLACLEDPPDGLVELRSAQSGGSGSFRNSFRVENGERLRGRSSGWPGGSRGGQRGRPNARVGPR